MAVATAWLAQSFDSQAPKGWTALGVDFLVSASLFVAGVPLVHEGCHWVLYKLAGCRPWLGRGRRRTKKIQLFVACEEQVTRQLLRVQLRFVPLAAAATMALVAGVVCLGARVVSAPHALLVGVSTGLATVLSGWADLRSDVFAKHRDARMFWDDGDGYRAADVTWDAAGEVCG